MIALLDLVLQRGVGTAGSPFVVEWVQHRLMWLRTDVLFITFHKWIKMQIETAW